LGCSITHPGLELFALEPEGLHGVAGDEVLVALETDAAFLPGRHLADVLLEVLEGADASLEDLVAAPAQLDPAAAADLAVEHSRAGRRSPSRRRLPRRRS